MNIKLNQRKIVFHLTYDYDMTILRKYINKDDILFFDDCLYSLYVFIKNNINLLNLLNVQCIISFSTKILRSIYAAPILCANCAEYHDKVHLNINAAYNAYMNINEIKELISLKNIFLAAHGARHLKLETIQLSKIKKYNMFANDINEMKKDLINYKLYTKIFVYPYAYDDLLLSNNLLKRHGFEFIFAGKNSKRIPIENIITGNMQTE